MAQYIQGSKCKILKDIILDCWSSYSYKNSILSCFACEETKDKFQRYNCPCAQL